MYFLIMYLIPLVSLIILNYKLITTLRRTRRTRESWKSTRRGAGGGGGGDQSHGSSSSSSSRSEDEITRMLIVVVIVFVFCQSPAFITQALPIIFPDSTSENFCPTSTFFYVRISDLLVVANSSLNFVIYCFCSPRFRRNFMTLVGCQAGEQASAPD